MRDSQTYFNTWGRSIIRPDTFLHNNQLKRFLRSSSFPTRDTVCILHSLQEQGLGVFMISSSTRHDRLVSQSNFIGNFYTIITPPSPILSISSGINGTDLSFPQTFAWTNPQSLEMSSLSNATILSYAIPTLTPTSWWLLAMWYIPSHFRLWELRPMLFQEESSQRPYPILFKDISTASVLSYAAQCMDLCLSHSFESSFIHMLIPQLMLLSTSGHRFHAFLSILQLFYITEEYDTHYWCWQRIQHIQFRIQRHTSPRSDQFLSRRCIICKLCEYSCPASAITIQTHAASIFRPLASSASTRLIISSAYTVPYVSKHARHFRFKRVQFWGIFFSSSTQRSWQQLFSFAIILSPSLSMNASIFSFYFSSILLLLLAAVVDFFYTTLSQTLVLSVDFTVRIDFQSFDFDFYFHCTFLLLI